jgi:hypothetical protein
MSHHCNLKSIATVLLVVLSYYPGDASGQSFILYGDRAYGGYDDEDHNQIIALDSIHLLLAGESTTMVGGDKTELMCDSVLFQNKDLWVVKIDTAFYKIWDKSIGGLETESGVGLPVIAGGNNIIFACASLSDSSCEKYENSKGMEDYWIYSIDQNGSKVWDKTLGGSLEDVYPTAIRLASGNYIVCGVSRSPVSGDKSDSNYGLRDYWVIKIDSLGNKLWDHVFGGPGSVTTSAGSFSRSGFSVIASDDDGFLIGGTIDSPSGGSVSDSSRGKRDIWVIKIDSSGNKVWDFRFGGSENDECNSFITAPGGGYILCGQTNSPMDGDLSDPPKGLVDCLVIKLDSSGQIEWNKRYGNTSGTIGTCISSAPGGGYWVSGAVSGGIAFDVTESGYGINQTDLWIFKIDSAGSKLWDKRFGGPGTNWGSTFVVMPDSSIFLSGFADYGTSPVKTDSGEGLFDYWIIHFKYNESVTSLEQDLTKFNSVSVYPNPVTEHFTVSYYLAERKVPLFIMYNSMGMEVLARELDPKRNVERISVEALAPGTYYWKAVIPGQLPAVGKLAVLR